MNAPRTRRLDEVFAVLKPDLAVDTVKVSPSLYADLDRDYDNFKGHTLVSLHEFSASWGMWEQHPAGDEVVVLLSGRVRFRIRSGDTEQAVDLAAQGDYVVVPRGRWHTAETDVATRVLFITPGEGTAHEKQD